MYPSYRTGGQINISNNISKRNIIVITAYSFLEVYGITNFYNNFAQDLLSMIIMSNLTLTGNTSFVNNSGTDITGDSIISIQYNCFLYTNATVIFDNNTGQSGSCIRAEHSYLEFNGITTFVNNYATDGGVIHI